MVAGMRPSGARRADQRTVVLDQPLERVEGQVEAVEGSVAALQPGDDAQALGIVVEAAIGRHQVIELALAGMAERRMAEVVGQRQGLRQVLVEAERAGDRAGDLGHLEAVGQPRAVVIALMIDEHLGLVLEAAEGGGMDDPVAVALEGRARRAFGLACSRPRLSQARVA
jgi:hypothetical protein